MPELNCLLLSLHVKYNEMPHALPTQHTTHTNINTYTNNNRIAMMLVVYIPQYKYINGKVLVRTTAMRH